MNTPTSRKKREKPSKTAHLRAAVAAATLLVASGWAMRALEARTFGDVPASASIPSLARLPLQIGPWAGQDVPIDPRLVEATDTDDLLNRRYVSSRGGDQIGVYIAAGNRARDLARHRPEVCYPGAGWTLKDVQHATVPLPDGGALECRIFRFSEGGFDLRQLVVLNYFIIDGVYCPDISLLRLKAWRGVECMLQVQVTCATDTFRDVQAARAAAVEFAGASAAAIHELLQPDPQAATAAQPSTSMP